MFACAEITRKTQALRTRRALRAQRRDGSCEAPVFEEIRLVATIEHVPVLRGVFLEFVDPKLREFEGNNVALHSEKSSRRKRSHLRHGVTRFRVEPDWLPHGVHRLRRLSGARLFSILRCLSVSGRIATRGHTLGERATLRESEPACTRCHATRDCAAGGHQPRVGFARCSARSSERWTRADSEVFIAQQDSLGAAVLRAYSYGIVPFLGRPRCANHL